MISGIITVGLLALFLGAWVWAWSPRRKAEFEQAALQPLEELAVRTERQEASP